MDGTFGSKLAGLAAAVGLLFASSAALADADVKSIVDARMTTMKQMERAIRDIGDGVGGLLPYDPEQGADKARMVRDETARIIERFPEGSVTELSEALPEIWADWAKFTQYADDTAKRAEQFLAAVNSNDSARITQALRTLNRSCSTCHSAFRK